jgi:hypothetical protein
VPAVQWRQQRDDRRDRVEAETGLENTDDVAHDRAREIDREAAVANDADAQQPFAGRSAAPAPLEQNEVAEEQHEQCEHARALDDRGRKLFDALVEPRGADFRRAGHRTTDPGEQQKGYEQHADLNGQIDEDREEAAAQTGQFVAEGDALARGHVDRAFHRIVPVRGGSGRVLRKTRGCASRRSWRGAKAGGSDSKLC